MSEDERSAWQNKRREAAAERAAALERRRAADSEKARMLVKSFTREARKQGLATTSLRAKAQNGPRTYPTGLTGWYLKRNGSLAVPVAPPLVVGVGGRDGESISLEQLLRLRLDAANAFPSL